MCSGSMAQCSDAEKEALQAKLNEEQQTLHELLDSVDKLDGTRASSFSVESFCFGAFTERLRAYVVNTTFEVCLEGTVLESEGRIH